MAEQAKGSSDQQADTIASEHPDPQATIGTTVVAQQASVATELANKTLPVAKAPVHKANLATLSYVQTTPREGAAAAEQTLTAIGRYRVVDEVGSGSFGKVYRCHDDQLKRDVAVKVRHDHDYSASTATEEFLHEARSVARLRHPNIVAVLDVGETDAGGIFILYEFVKGKTLKQRIDARDYTREQGLSWLVEVAEALHHAHKQGLVHRDIKPGNVLVDEYDKTRLADFGLATIDDKFYTEQTGRVLGTVAYMSPEQARGQSQWATSQSDIYSLGVMMYEMLCGRRPFSADSLSELLEQVQHRTPPPPRTIKDDIPRELEEICLKAMQKEPAARYRTAGDFASDLRRALAGPKKPASVVPYLVGAAALAGVAAFMIWGRPDAEKATGGTGAVAPAAVAGIPAPVLDIHLQRSSQADHYEVIREGDVPLHEGDKVQLHALLDGPGYVYLYWYDSEGKPTRLWPEPKQSLAKQQPVSEVWSPQNAQRGSQSEWWPISGTPGPQMAFAAVADHPLNESELKIFEAKTFDLSTELAKRDTLVEFERNVRSRTRRSRGLGASTVVSPKKVLRDFEPQLNTLFTYYHGWVFFYE